MGMMQYIIIPGVSLCIPYIFYCQVLVDKHVSYAIFLQSPKGDTGFFNFIDIQHAFHIYQPAMYSQRQADVTKTNSGYSNILFQFDLSFN